MCLSCEPGLGQLIQCLTSDLDFSSSSQPVPSTTVPKTPQDENPKIFCNGAIITLSGGDFSPADALVVKEDTIVYTGSLDGAKKAAGPDAKVVDLQGQCLLPGFIEPHLHLIPTAFDDQFLTNLSPLKVHTIDQAIQVISAQAQEAPPGHWVAGFGYDPSRIQGNSQYGDHPDLTKKMLDSINKNVPIFIINQSGHIGYANSAAFKAALIFPEEVQRDPNFQKDKGELTGLVFEKAVSRVAAFISPKPKIEDLVNWCKSTLTGWISKGFTTVFDAGIGLGGAADLALLEGVQNVPIRTYGAGADSTILKYFAGIKQPPLTVGQYKIIAIKYWADGSTQGFTAFVKEPYLNPPTWAKPCGNPNYPNSDALEKAMDPWLKAGYQLVVHSNGDAATDLTLDAYESVLQKNPGRSKDMMHRIEHFTVTESSQLVRAKNLGLTVTHLIGHVNYWGETFRDYVLGPARAERLDPLKEDEAVGLVWSLHSDSPVTDANPLMYIKTATTRLLYQSEEQLGPEYCVDLLAALKAVTINPAKQIGIADQVGTLEVGKKADMVVLDKDPGDVALADLDQLAIVQTWINGNLEYSSA